MSPKNPVEIQHYACSYERKPFFFLENPTIPNCLKTSFRLELHQLHDLGWYVRNGVHFGLFLGALSGQGSDEQRAEWMPRAMMCQIYGCFGMTELGHGSFLRGLETTAHFDKETQVGSYYI